MRERVIEIVKQAASEFINRESNRTSMITVTGIELDRREAHATIFVSVFPAKDTHGATDFLNRNRDEFKKHLKKFTSLRMIPRVQFMPDPNMGTTPEE